MRPLIARRALPEPHDPAPSRLSYRVTRLWLTPIFRKFLRIGIPCFALSFCVLWYLSDPGRITDLRDAVQEVRREIENRPEFRVNVVGIDGAGPEVLEEVRGALALNLPVSSFDLDLDQLRARVEALPAVRTADLRIQSGGYLAVVVEERVPVMIWQTHEGLSLIDAEGHFVAGFEQRVLTEALPQVAGDGADRAVEEAQALFAAAAPLADRLRGIVRMGERRWDIVLTDGRRILLPETGAVDALDRVLALEDLSDILSRDVVRIDLRNPGRLTVQLTQPALEELRRMRGLTPETLPESPPETL